MNKLILCFFSVFIVTAFWGQTAMAQIALEYNDTTICPGNELQMCAAFSGEADPLSTDDDFTGALDIGFDFEYFGETYSQCILSDNGFLSFDMTYAGDFSSWTWAGSTGSGEANNAIHAAFQDGLLDPNIGGGGALRYQYFGTPGNRRFIAEWCKVGKYGCGQFVFTTQIILYEGSNIIEIHTTDLPGTPGCPTTNGGANGIQGLRSIGGATEIYTPNRGPADNWGVTGAVHDARRFTPDGADNYTIDSIPFNPWIIIDNASSADLVWFAQDAPNAPIATGACATVTPTGAEDYYTVRFDGIAGCLEDTVSFIDTVWINYATTYDTVNAAICVGESYNFYGAELYAPGQYDTLFSSAMGCDSLITLNLSTNPLPDVTISSLYATIEVCEGNPASIALANPVAGSTYQWLKDGMPMNGETEPTLVLQDPGIYTVMVTTDKGCIATSLPYTFVVHPTPVADITPISGDILCSYDTVTLTAVPGLNYDYRWSPEAPFRLITGAEGQTVKGMFNAPHTVVTLTVFNEFGCYDSTSVDVYTKPCCEVFTPSAFSPNADGINDYFNPQLQPGQILTNMVVYDRYGKLVYNSTNIEQGWDGRYENGEPAAQGTYMYMIKYTCDDGKDYERKESITLVR